MFEILFSDKAWKQLSKLEKPIQKKIINSLDRIRIRPEAYLAKLADDPAYKLRVGDYRVIIDLDKGKLLILVIKAGHRRTLLI